VFWRAVTVSNCPRGTPSVSTVVRGPRIVRDWPRLASRWSPVPRQRSGKPFFNRASVGRIHKWFIFYGVVQRVHLCETIVGVGLLCRITQFNPQVTLRRDMDDPARLRQTVRRCTAALITAIGIGGLGLSRGDGSGDVIFLLLIFSSILYLVIEFIRHTPATPEDSGDPSNSGTTETSNESG
jgi:hypothetical protein